MNMALRVTTQALNASCRRYFSSKKLPREIVTVMSKDMIVCWHPEPEFPYEYSLPLPEEKQSSNSVLCVGQKEIAETFKFKTRENIVEELSKITYTTKHRWYPRNRDRKSKPVDTDRTYL